MNLAGISLKESDGQVFVQSQPVEGRPPVESSALRALLVQEGYGQWHLLDDAIASTASQCNSQQDPFELLVAQRLDAEIKVQIAPDEMEAYLTITPSQGGKVATMDDVNRLLAEAGVVSGIDETALQQLSKMASCNQLPVAHGVVQQNGCDTVFEELIPQTVNREPRLNEDGLIDYREHSVIAVVLAGAPLMRRTPATPGVDGLTVKSRVLTAHPGRDEAFAAELPGAQVTSEDPNVLQASMSGQPVRVKCGVMVESVLRVPEVNMTTGNIHFEGSVHVEGEVVQGMKIHASGDIFVGGMVDGGQLEAGGNILVSGGVIAHASLRAGGSVTARFAESSHIYAGTVIVLGDMALECELQSLNQIIIGAESPQRGRLIGGTTTAMMLLRVPLLGSSKSSMTKVVMGANPELQAKYEALQQRIDHETTTEANLEKLVKQLTAAGDPKGMLARVKASRQHTIQVWGQLLVERAELELQLELAGTAKVEVSVGVAGAVDLSFGKTTARLRRELDAGTFSVDVEGHVVFTDATDQTATPV